MNFNPVIHHRRSIRLREYDYSQAGLYFITLVVQNRLHLFGRIENGEMILNDAGHAIEKWYREIEYKYPDKRCHEMIVMPNHFHCVIENVHNGNVTTMDADCRGADIQGAHVGAPLRGRPITDERERSIKDDRERSNDDDDDGQPEKYGMHNIKYGATIGDAMDWFKTMTTNEYIRGVKTWGWEPFNGKLWQRNYYEHIIRTDESYQRIANYIENNPANWDRDSLNPANT
jgi:putative transposase